MRLVLRSQVRALAAGAADAKPRAAGSAHREWIVALFAEHLPRRGPARERAIETLAGDGHVWRLLHQARYSMAETSAVIERLARAALTAEPLRAA